MILRIVVPTLMTGREIAMTTRGGVENGGFRVVLTSNVFEPNDCINLAPGRDANASARLAGICVLCSRLPRVRNEAIRDCARYAWDSFLGRIPSMTCWLFACICGESGRITRHKGLWNVLAAEGVSTGAGATEENFVENDDGLCVYGATPFDGGRMEEVLPVVQSRSNCFLAMLPSDQSPRMERVIAAGWNEGFFCSEVRRDCLAGCRRAEGRCPPSVGGI
jgi:hypothetical protein